MHEVKGKRKDWPDPVRLGVDRRPGLLASWAGISRSELTMMARTVGKDRPRCAKKVRIDWLRIRPDLH
jgi:hypothetical protein